MGEFVIVYRVWSDPEAQVIKSLLESSGIRCKLVSHVPHSVYPVTVDGLGEVRIMVPQEQEETARALIAAYRERDRTTNVDDQAGQQDREDRETQPHRDAGEDHDHG